MFYILSLITGILECGWIANGVCSNLPLCMILCYPLSYHFGNLFPKPFALGKSFLEIMALLSFISGSAMTITSLKLEFPLTCITLFMLSATIQSVRGNIKSDDNRLLKRVFRVGGFLISPVAIYVPSLIIILTSLLALYGLRSYETKPAVLLMKSQNGFSLVMIFHQLHYFFYAHITLAAVSIKLLERYNSGAFIGAVLFCLTWITYMLVEPLVSEFTRKNLPVFFAGHIGISLLLLCMAFIEKYIFFIVLWVITGFGGGVVYTIRRMAKERNCYSGDSMDIAENIGHTAGLIAAVLVAYASPYSPKIMLVCASVSAMLAVISMALCERRAKGHENI